MSCFSGKLKEYPSFSVDCFDKNNLDSDVYFLSHCHKDHMNGLDSPTFLNRLKSSQNVLVHCSETTRNILLCDLKYKHLDGYVIGLPIDHPTMITVKDDLTGKSESVCVTLVPAGHCIGSVMFLFEGNNKNVLYTGDFRLSKGDTSRIAFFHSGDSIKDIASIYVDTTFCLPQMKTIPGREATKNAVVGLIKRWLKQGPNYYVSLLCKGMYGYEYLLKEVAIDLKTKIHVSPERLTLYKNLPDMTEYFTTEAKTTKIHSCNWERDRHPNANLPCGLTLPAPQKMKVMKIKASSMWFSRRKEPLPADCVVKVHQDFYRVVHSMHASMEEIYDLVGYLRPLNIYANVEPAGLYSIQHTEESLKRFTRFNGRDAPSAENSEETHFQEHAGVFANITLDEGTPAPHKEQKSSNISRTSDSTCHPSKEVLAQCKQLDLVQDDTLACVPRRRRRRRNQDVATKDMDDDAKNLRKKSTMLLHPHKRRILQYSEEKNEITDEVCVSDGPTKGNNSLVRMHLSGGDNGVHHQKVDFSCKESLSATPTISSLRTVQNVFSDEKRSSVDDTALNPVQDQELRTGLTTDSRVGIVRDNTCLLGDVKDGFCVPASPGHERPSNEMLVIMHKNLSQRGLLHVACLQD